MNTLTNIICVYNQCFKFFLYLESINIHLNRREWWALMIFGVSTKNLLSKIYEYIIISWMWFRNRMGLSWLCLTIRSDRLINVKIQHLTSQGHTQNHIVFETEKNNLILYLRKYEICSKTKLILFWTEMNEKVYRERSELNLNTTI